MATKFSKDAKVRQVLPKPIEGVVNSFKFSETDGQIRYLVKWVDDQGVEHERVFDEDQIELVPEEAGEADTPEQ